MRGPIRGFRTNAAAATACLAVILSAGCATPPPKSDPDALADYKATNDPFEPTNRVFYSLNDGLLTYVLTPVARGYNYVLPQPVRTGIHNVLNNLGSPVQFANDVMETRPRRAGDTFVRFVVNSTVGLGGVFDVASALGYPDHSADGGLTLAVWGVPAGPYLYLPLFGPSGVRDGVGRGVDQLVNPYTWVNFDGVNHLNVISTGLSALDGVAPHLDDLRKLNEGALDPYATQRSLYRQLQQTRLKALQDDRRATVPAWYPQDGQVGGPKPSTPAQRSLPLPVISPVAAHAAEHVSTTP